MAGRRTWRWVIGIALSVSTVATGEPGPTGWIARGKRFETPYFVRDSGRPGPTVMIVGGVHGNEPAGARAAGQIRHWRLRRGKLLVVPRANVLALDAGQRRTPREPEATADLNRNFPSSPGDSARGPLAKALWAFIRSQKPDWVLDMHEGYGFRAAGSRSVGSSLIHDGGAVTRRRAESMRRAVNVTIDQADKKFVLLRPPARGSLARGAADRLGAKAMILETTYRGQPLARRARQLRLMAHCLLRQLEMSAGEVDQVLAPRAGATSRPGGSSGEPLRVAVYCDAGTLSDTAPLRLEAIVTSAGGVVAELLSAPAIRAGALGLGSFDVVVFPGGSGHRQAEALGKEGAKAVRAFLRAGGGYVGLCAGAYLATRGYSWSLGIVNVKAVDTRHWRRGKGTVKMELTAAGRAVLAGPTGTFDIPYANGPILAPAKDKDLPPAIAWGCFRTELAENGAPKGVMVGTPAAVAGPFGAGRVVVFSPHPDKAKPLHTMVRRAVAWAGRKQKVLLHPSPVK